MAPAVATYEPRDPSRTVLYKVIADHLETFLASLDADPDAKGLPAYVQREFYDYLQCGILAHGFLRPGCDTCQQELLLPFSCKRRGFCPSCAGRRMAQTAAHLVECVIPWVPTRQWVVSVPIPLRYWMARPVRSRERRGGTRGPAGARVLVALVWSGGCRTTGVPVAHRRLSPHYKRREGRGDYRMIWASYHVDRTRCCGDSTRRIVAASGA
jgi:hypothetical protein